MPEPPLVLGVSGHIKLHPDDLPLVRQSVHAVLDSVASELPERPLRILSSLAEGADRLVVQETAAHQPHLTAVLPMPPEDYERDFATPASRAEFRNLLARAEQVVRADLAAEPDAPSRYTASDRYLARHSDLLIALWDGLPTNKEAGTAWVLGQRLDDPAAPTAGPVVHVSCRREDQPPPEQPASVRWLLPGWREAASGEVLRSC